MALHIPFSRTPTQAAFATPTRERFRSIVCHLPGNSLGGGLLCDVFEAIAFIEAFDASKPITLLARYEVGVRYSNGDEIRGQFKDKNYGSCFPSLYSLGSGIPLLAKR